MAVIGPLDLTDRRLAEEALAVQLAAYRIEASLIGSDAIPPLKENVEDVQQLDLQVVGLLVDDRVVALVGYKCTWKTIDIDRLVVDPAHFRRGYARQLLEHLHDAEKSATFKVSTASANRPAIELYLSAGYQPRRHVVKGGVRITRLRRPRPRRWRIRAADGSTRS